MNTAKDESTTHLRSLHNTPDVEKARDVGSPTRDDEQKENHYCGVPAVLFAGMCYCAASGSMVLLNKHALASFSFHAPSALLFYQCAVSVLMVKLCEMAGLVRLQPLRLQLVLVWFPVNLIFVGMIGTSFYALQAVGVGMVTVWKNLSNFVTAVGDVVIYKKSYTLGVWLVLCLMMSSAVIGASTDSKFSWTGYSWQAANCIFTSAYALYLRSVMDRVAEHTDNKQKMDEFSMVWYNNLLSLIPIGIMMVVFGEHSIVLSQPALYDPAFIFVSTLGAFIGFGISFFSLWFLSQTTATIYSLVGALNKIPVAIIGIIAFQESTNPKNLASIAIGLGAGILFVKVKQQAARK